MAKICIVAAIGKNRELGKEGKLLWHIPDDLRRFKMLTKGHPIILGRKTFESIVAYLGKPLPDRINIVVTRDASYAAGLAERSLLGAIVAPSLDEAIQKARSFNPEEIHIGGGAEIYQQILPKVDKLFLTLVDDAKEADSFFPPYEHLFTTKTFEDQHEYKGLKYTWVDLERGE